MRDSIKNRVLFLGLGHLGKVFLDQNQTLSITGTKRKLSDDTACPLLSYDLNEKWKGPRDFDSIIISFPPSVNYSSKLEELLNQLGPFHQLIFISSTSVFGLGHITEESPKHGKSKNALELIRAEEIISKYRGLILRPGGLIDEKRHPQHFLKRVSTISKSKTPVNLVHTADVASFLHFAINNGLSNDSYNLICDDHPTKEEFYGQFDLNCDFDSKDSQQRIISNLKSKEAGFTYMYPSLDWV